MSERPSDADLARLLRTGADAVMSSHSEYCISSDKCSCYRDAEEMEAAATALDEAGGLVVRRPDAEEGE